MKALIMSVTAGQGHHATAKAISDALAARGVTVSTLDMFEYVSPRLKDVINDGYLLSTKVLPKGFGRAYELLNKNRPSKKGSLNWMTSQILMRELEGYVRALDPQIVISTHPFSSVTLDAMVQSRVVRGVTAGVITDFTVHPFWEEAGHLDYYVTASPLLALQLVRKGLSPAKMLPYGIPVQEKFSYKIPQDRAREQLGLDVNKRTLLLMSGSMGFGRMDLSIKKLDHLPMDFQAMVVCGNNHQMQERIRSLHLTKDFRVYGYVSNVDQMMDAADCIITKPGGLTSTEALTKELPMIMVNEIPGQEARNMEFLLNNQLAMGTSKTYPLEEAVYTLFSNPRLLHNLQTNAADFACKDSADRVAQALTAASARRTNN